MATKMMPLAILLLLALMESPVHGGSGGDGCSFNRGECTYNVKLGQCEGQSQAQFAQWKDDMEDMKLKVDFLLNSTRDAVSRTKLEEALNARNDILAVLQRRQKELNNTKDQLAKVIGIATKEVKSLRDNLAIMDKSLTSCRLREEQAPVATTPRPSVRPKVEVGPSNYSTTYCSFTDSMCGFRTTSEDSFILVVKMNKGSSLDTGPRVEHSLGISSGYYLGLYSQYTALNRYDQSGKVVSAKSLSKTFPPANAYCIMFWYYMRGADVRTLSVNLETKSGTGHNLFSKSGQTETDEWQLAKIDVAWEYASKGFKFDFNMTTNAFYKFKAGIQHLYNEHGDIAVDDLYVMNTTCDSVLSYPDGAYIYTGYPNTTSYYTFYSTPLNWFDAFDTCRRRGPFSAPVSIESYHEQQFLAKIILTNDELNEAGLDGYYTSGTDIDEEGSFVWTNTGMRRSVGDGTWNKGQPDNEGGNQDCLLLEYPYNGYEWGDVNCKTKHPFICEATYPN